MNIKAKSLKYAKGATGFSLVELLVSMAILVLMFVVIIYSQNTFNDQIALSNSVNEIELQVREAQVYGVSVKDYRAFQQTTSDFSSAYGVSFNLTSAAGTNGPRSTYFFIDRNPANSAYDATSWSSCTVGGTSECLKLSSLTRGNVISRICAINSSGVDVCGPTSIARVDISFLRPSPNARFKFWNSSASDVTTSYPNPQGAKIEVRSPRNALKTVIVYSNGQISIQ